MKLTDNEAGMNARAGPLGFDASIRMCKIFVDAHVHIHKCFHLSTFFDSAIANFQAASKELGKSEELHCFILLLAESTHENSYLHLSDLAAAGQCLSSHNGLTWSFHHTSEEGGLRALRSDGRSVFLLAGRQIVTAEKLEVLGLLTPTVFEDHQPLSQTVQDVRNAGGLPVIPWGFGKWMGKRRRILKQFLLAHDQSLFLGDNSGRPCFIPCSGILSGWEAKGLKVLPGSDPLPFVSEQNRGGCFGFTLQAAFDPDFPVGTLKRILLQPNLSPQPFGTLERPTRFVRNQLGMQVHRKRSKSG